MDVMAKIVDRVLYVLQSLRRSERADDITTPAGEEAWRARRRLLLQHLNRQADDLADLDSDPVPTHRNTRQA